MNLTSTDAIAMDELPISLWVDAVSFDMSSDNAENDNDDAAMLAYGSPSSPSATTTTTTTAPGKFLASDLYFMDDTMMLDLDEVAIWGSADDSTIIEATTAKTQLLEVDASWAMVELSDALTIDQKTLELSLESSEKKTADESSPPPPKSEPAVVTASKKNLNKTELMASSSPPHAAKSTPSPKTKTRQRKVNDDPTARVHQRKSKQRGYERNYRGRLRDQRCQDEFEWLHYEAEMREALARKRALPLSPQTEQQDKTSALVQLIHEERALQEERMYLRCTSKWLEALDIWGVETEASRNIRYEINALPQVRGLPQFTDFSW
ncbi:hypothetical protein Gpo141_00013820 [Globisporangium polare]